MEVCSNFLPGAWKPKQCCICFHLEKDHSKTDLVLKPPTPPLPIKPNSTRIVHSSRPSTTVESSLHKMTREPASTSTNQDPTDLPLTQAVISDESSLNDPLIDNGQAVSHSENGKTADENSCSYTSRDLISYFSNGVSATHSDESDVHINDQNTTSQQQEPQYFTCLLTVTDETNLDTISPDQTTINPLQDQCSSFAPSNISPSGSCTTKIPCKYGAHCYRKNPQHLQNYFHPHKTPKPNDTQSTVNSKLLTANEQEVSHSENGKTVDETSYSHTSRDLISYSNNGVLATHSDESGVHINDQSTTNQQQEQQYFTCLLTVTGENNVDIISMDQSRISPLQDQCSSVAPSNISPSGSCTTKNPSLWKTPCKHGASCYRKNPQHLQNYFHPHKTPKPNDTQFTVNEKLSTANDSSTGDGEQIAATAKTDSETKRWQTEEELKQQESKTELERQKTEEDVQRRIAEIEFKWQDENKKLHDQILHAEAERKKAQLHLELAEKQFLESMTGVDNEKKCLKESIENLREEIVKTAAYHQQLENALSQELNDRERREIERQRVLAIRRDVPSYWGTNAFEQPYREITISSRSPEFKILQDLLNDTIKTHGDKFGAIYGKDPTEFIVTSITRIHSKMLWHEYCFKKESIIEKNEHGIMNCDSSRYLNDCPLSTPLLDNNANEYWLFHGCDENIIPTLTHSGYDPRVSSLDGMFGGGFYLAENSSKSNQYIPCPGCNKNSIFGGEGCRCKNQENIEFSIILYRAVLGDIHIAKQYDRKKYCKGENERRIRRPPRKENSDFLYDSVMGESVTYGGDILKYREFILYESGQAYPEYVIKFRRSAANARAPSNITRVINNCHRFLRNTIKLRPD